MRLILFFCSLFIFVGPASGQSPETYNYTDYYDYFDSWIGNDTPESEPIIGCANYPDSIDLGHFVVLWGSKELDDKIEEECKNSLTGVINVCWTQEDLAAIGTDVTVSAGSHICENSLAMIATELVVDYVIETISTSPFGGPEVLIQLHGIFPGEEEVISHEHPANVTSPQEPSGEGFSHSSQSQFCPADCCDEVGQDRISCSASYQSCYGMIHPESC